MSTPTPHERAAAIFATEIPEVDVAALTPTDADREAYSPADRPAPSPRLYARGTPVRNVRLDDDRWTAITDLAERTGSTASDVMRDALDAYLDRRP